MVNYSDFRRGIELFDHQKAVAVLDVSGRVLVHNPRFDALLKGTRTRIDADHKLILAAPDNQTAFEGALTSDDGGPGGAFPVKSDETNQAWICRITPKQSFTSGAAEPRHAVMICERIDTPMVLDRSLVQVFFELTPTETDIAALLFEGNSARKIAELRETSMETVRSHIKRLLQKTQSKRQAELVTKLARFTT